jgi:hypothetical protein
MGIVNPIVGGWCVPLMSDGHPLLGVELRVVSLVSMEEDGKAPSAAFGDGIPWHVMALAVRLVVVVVDSVSSSLSGRP